MSSLLTNTSALTALKSLASTQKALGKTQNEISTGLRVSEAADNASYWSIATTMKSDNGALGAVKDSLAQSATMLDVATAAVNSTIEVMNKIKDGLVAAKQPGADTAKIATELGQLSEQLKSSVASASMNKQNWLDGSKATVSLVAAFNRDGTSGETSVATIDLTTQTLIDTAGTAGILVTAKAASSTAATDLTQLTATDLASATIDDTIKNVDDALGKIVDYSATLGATKSRVELQQNFVKSLSDAITSGVSALIDADMNESSTRLQALQTQQQLGVQSLSIANQNSQLILRLFQ